jgi:hypothetical protein
MRFVSVCPVREKTLSIIKDELIVGEYIWIDDSTKISEINAQLVANGFGELTESEIAEINEHIEIIKVDKESVE